MATLLISKDVYIFMSDSRDHPEASKKPLAAGPVTDKVFNISLIWDQNIDRDMESRAYLIRSWAEGTKKVET